MKIIVGLGNPGPDFTLTRHNAGMMLVDILSDHLHSDYGWRKHGRAMVFETSDFVLIKSAGVFMNESGYMLHEFLRTINYELSNLYVAHDDLDIRLGDYKIQQGTGPKVHYGVQSIEAVLGTKDFWRIRIGIDNRDPQNRTPGEKYVLEKFTHEEKIILDKTLNEIAQGLN